jgi:hypothetical protein
MTTDAPPVEEAGRQKALALLARNGGRYARTRGSSQYRSDGRGLGHTGRYVRGARPTRDRGDDGR